MQTIWSIKDFFLEPLLAVPEAVNLSAIYTYSEGIIYYVIYYILLHVYSEGLSSQKVLFTVFRIHFLVCGLFWIIREYKNLKKSGVSIKTAIAK